MARLDWPSGLKDEEAILRLQSLMVDACEGRRDLSVDREYKRLRKPLIARPDLSDVVPKYVRANQDLTSFWSYIRRVSDQWEPRRQHVWETFEPLFARIEGRTSSPIAAAKWTGRRTAAQQAQIVLSLAPDALLAVDMLLEEQERPLHNGGPIDTEREEAIRGLRALRDALTELVSLAEAGRPLISQVSQLRSLARKVLGWSVSPYGLSLGGIPLFGMAGVFGAATWQLVNAISPGQGGAAGSVAAATYVAAAGVRAAQGRERG